MLGVHTRSVETGTGALTPGNFGVAVCMKKKVT